MPAPTLDYRTSQVDKRRSLGSITAIFAPPTLGFLITVAAAMHNRYEEPFGNYSVHDAMLQVGQAVVAGLGWIA